MTNRRRFLQSAGAGMLAGLSHPAFSAARAVRDMIVVHAKLWTVDPARPRAKAIAVSRSG